MLQTIVPSPVNMSLMDKRSLRVRVNIIASQVFLPALLHLGFLAYHAHVANFTLVASSELSKIGLRNIDLLQKVDRTNTVSPDTFQSFVKNPPRNWIESMPKDLPTAEHYKCLFTCEMYWIYTLDTLAPGGLNEELEIGSLL